MNSHGTASPEQFAELHAALVRQCPRDIDYAPPRDGLRIRQSFSAPCGRH